MSGSTGSHRFVERWTGKPMTVGTVAVVGLGKIGLPLVAQFASSGWKVIGVDVLPDVVETVNRGGSHIAEEPGLSERLAEAHSAGRLEATSSHEGAARRSDVIVMVVPLMLSDGSPDYRYIDAATTSIAMGLTADTLVIYETTLPVGDTRRRFGPILERGSGLSQASAESGFRLAFSPERVYSGRIFSDLANYPKIVGGVDGNSAARAEAFYRSTLEADVWTLRNSESAEFAKLAETTYRDVNIALANEFARFAERVDVDVFEVIAASNSQPYSHIHEPGLGVGGHCIPVYPKFLLAAAPELEIVEASRRINDEQVDRAIDTIEKRVESLSGVEVLVLGITYRYGVHELANSRALSLIERLRDKGASVHAFDPLLEEREILAIGAEPYSWGEPSDAQVIITQTKDPRWVALAFDDFPKLALVYDGRNSLRELTFPSGVAYLGVGRVNSNEA